MVQFITDARAPVRPGEAAGSLEKLILIIVVHRKDTTNVAIAAAECFARL